MSVENEKEIQQLKNRIRELADKSYNQNQYTFTGFLGLAEQDALWQVEREVKFAGITLYGGREEAERKILRFGSAMWSASSGPRCSPNPAGVSCRAGGGWSASLPGTMCPVWRSHGSIIRMPPRSCSWGRNIIFRAKPAIIIPGTTQNKKSRKPKLPGIFWR